MKFLHALLFISFSTWLGFCEAHHAGPHPILYVAQHGTDQGSCRDPKHPCQSLDYALRQASKGDRVQVATGTYPVSENSLFYLITGAIDVLGGYRTDFSGRAKDNTQLTGVPTSLRTALAKKGFRIIRDRKRAPSDSLTAAVDTYQRLQKPAVQGQLPCRDGLAGDFPCHNVDLIARMPLSAMSSHPTSANDVWGFVDLNQQREYALIGLDNGIAIFDLSTPESPKEVVTIPGASSIWRDIKVYQYFDHNAQRYRAYAYVTTEANQGLQIIDLNQLPETATVVNTMTDFMRAHNVNLSAVDPATGLATNTQTPVLHIAGADISGGVFRLYRLDDPVHPSPIATGAFSGSYMHDSAGFWITAQDPRSAQCAAGYGPCHLLADFSEDSIDLWDITTPSQPKLLSQTSYAGVGYVHSGSWSQDGRYLFVQDELDEVQTGQPTTLRIFNMDDLVHPALAGQYLGTTLAIDHNGFAVGTRYYMSNYRRGLTVLDISDPLQPTEIGYFDTFPVPAENSAQFDGAWGVYPYLPSGHILVSDIANGLFVVKVVEENSVNPPPSTPSQSSGGTMDWLNLVFFLLVVAWYRPRVKS